MESNTFVYHRVEQSLFTPGIYIIKESKELSKYEQAETSKLLTRAQHFDDFFIRQQPANSGLRLNGILSVGRLWRHAMQRVPFKKVVSGRPTVAVGRSVDWPFLLLLLSPLHHVSVRPLPQLGSIKRGQSCYLC